MKKITLLTFITLLLAILPAGGLWAAPPDIFPLKDIKPGMKGYGLTVFKNAELSRFEAEILGVLKGFFPQQDIILARLSAPQLKDIGVVAGMSGSPVFLEDKIIGAVAYGWQFSKEPIAGITPIENMLKILDLAEEQKHSAIDSRSNLITDRDSLAPYPCLKFSREQILGPPLADILSEGVPLELEPLATPLCISNCDPRILPLIKKRFSRYHLMPVISGKASLSERGEAGSIKLEPGAALGVQLMSGDMDLSAIGTVTYVKDDKVLAFGHPMFLNGNIRVPMTTALIFSVMPSLMRPFKLGGVIEPVGALRQDRMPAVAGFVGESAPMVPLSVKINVPSQNLDRTYSYQIWEDKEFSPFLVFIGVIESIFAAYKASGENAAAMHYKISLDDGTIFEKDDFISNPLYIDRDLIWPIEYDLSRLLINQFKEVRLKNIEYSVRMIDKTKTAYLITARTDKEEYQPGDNVKITIWLQPYREERQKVSVEITLPQNIEEDEYMLMIMDGRGREEFEYKRAPGLQEAHNFQQLVRNLKRHYPANNIYLLLQNPVVGLTVEGEELPELPFSIRSAISSSSAPGLANETTGFFLAEKQISTEYVVSGMERLKISVKRLKTF